MAANPRDMKPHPVGQHRADSIRYRPAVTRTLADMLDGATESAIIVPVPETERVVGRHRQVLDRAASRGVPAHITVQYPFIRPDQVTTSTIAEIEAQSPVSACRCARPLAERCGGIPRFVGEVALFDLELCQQAQQRGAQGLELFPARQLGPAVLDPRRGRVRDRFDGCAALGGEH